MDAHLRAELGEFTMGVRWSDNQRKRWGSNTISTGELDQQQTASASVGSSTRCWFTSSSTSRTSTPTVPSAVQPLPAHGTGGRLPGRPRAHRCPGLPNDTALSLPGVPSCRSNSSVGRPYRCRPWASQGAGHARQAEWVVRSHRLEWVGCAQTASRASVPWLSDRAHSSRRPEPGAAAARD